MLTTMISFKTAVTREHPSRIFGFLRVKTIKIAPTKETMTAKKGFIESISMVVTDSYLKYLRRFIDDSGKIHFNGQHLNLRGNQNLPRLFLDGNLDLLVLMGFRL